MRSFRELFVQQLCALDFYSCKRARVRERMLQKVDREREREGGEKKRKSRMEIRLGRRDNKSSHPGVFHPPASNRPPPSPSRDKRLKEIQNSRKSRLHGKAFVASGLICLIFCVEETSAIIAPRVLLLLCKSHPFL